MKRLTHVDKSGAARMVNVSAKKPTRRRAVARSFVRMKPATLLAIREARIAKGDVIAVARLAAIQAAKRTGDLIPLCHPLPLTHVAVDISLGKEGVAVECTVETVSRTGVEMEALTGAAVGALTLYDMCKAADRWMTITDVELMEKSGGRSGGLKRGA